MRLDPRWSPEPDLLVVRADRRHLMGRHRLEGPADLVIEIASESDPGLDVREKLPRYRSAGIEEIWMVDPFAMTLHAETRGPAGYRARDLSEGRLASKVLAGFWLEVSWLSKDELPSTVRSLGEILA